MNEIQNIGDLEEMGFKVDLIPKNFKRGGLFIMNQMLYLHLGNQICIVVSFEDEIMEIPKA